MYSLFHPWGLLWQQKSIFFKNKCLLIAQSLLKIHVSEYLAHCMLLILIVNKEFRNKIFESSTSLYKPLILNPETNQPKLKCFQQIQYTVQIKRLAMSLLQARHSFLFKNDKYFVWQKCSYKQRFSRANSLQLLDVLKATKCIRHSMQFLI